MYWIIWIVFQCNVSYDDGIIFNIVKEGESFIHAVGLVLVPIYKEWTMYPGTKHILIIVVEFHDFSRCLA